MIPSSLIPFLEKCIPGFDRETCQLPIAKMLWMTLDPVREHKHYIGAISISEKEIRSLFLGTAKKFNEINRNPRQRYFSVSEHKNNRKKSENVTKGFSPMPWMERALTLFLESEPTPTELLNEKGQLIHKIPRAISSLDSSGLNAIGWQGITVTNLIKVNTRNLQKIEEDYKLLLKALRQGIDVSEYTDISENRVHWRVTAARILRLLATTKNFNGYIPQHYIQSSSGRLYSPSISLQTCPKEIRKAALENYWDYDIDCCHFAILGQMVQKLGFSCPAISNYVSNKNQIRGMIAGEVGITVGQVKTVLTATIYGAQRSQRSMDAIPKEIGLDAANRLYRSPTYNQLKDELATAKSAVLKNHPQLSGQLINLFRKKIKPSEDPDTVMSHLLQGVEACALRAAIKGCMNEVILLQHDGFTTSKRIDCKKAEKSILKATGYVLTLQEEQIRYPLKDLSLLNKLADTKVMETPEANTDMVQMGILGSFPTTIAYMLRGVPPPYPDALPDIPDPFKADPTQATYSGPTMIIPYKEALPKES